MAQLTCQLQTASGGKSADVFAALMVHKANAPVTGTTLRSNLTVVGHGRNLVSTCSGLLRIVTSGVDAGTWPNAISSIRKIVTGISTTGWNGTAATQSGCCSHPVARYPPQSRR